METWETPASQPTPTDTLSVNPEIKNALLEAAKWARFLGIVGYVFVGLLVILAIFFTAFMGSIMERAAEGNEGNPFSSGAFSIVMGVYMLLIALLYYFPSRYLHQFGVKTQSALRRNEQMDFNSAFVKLKSFFKFFGIFTAIFIVLYGAALVFMALFGAMFGNAG